MGKCSVWIVNLLGFDEVKIFKIRNVALMCYIKLKKRYNFTQIYRLLSLT